MAEVEERQGEKGAEVKPTRAELERAFRDAVTMGGYCFAANIGPNRPCSDNFDLIRRVRNRTGFESWHRTCQKCSEDYFLARAKAGKGKQA